MRQEPCRGRIIPKFEPIDDKLGAGYLQKCPQQNHTLVRIAFREEFARARHEQAHALVPLPIGVPLLCYDSLRLVS